jgi:hypothetical protein
LATEATPQIHAEMAAILDELPAIGKDSSNDALRFNFRGIEAIVNAVNPLLGKHGVVPVLTASQLLHYEPKAKGYAAVVLNTYRFTAKDGSYIEAQAVGEGHDFGDKAVAKACTMAQKTCLGQTFCLAFEDDPDGDSVQQTPPAKPRAAARSAKAGTPAPPSPPAKPGLDQQRAELYSKVKSLSPEEIETLKGWLGEQGIGLDFSAHTVEEIDKIEAELVTSYNEPF